METLLWNGGHFPFGSVCFDTWTQQSHSEAEQNKRAEIPPETVISSWFHLKPRFYGFSLSFSEIIHCSLLVRVRCPTSEKRVYLPRRQRGIPLARRTKLTGDSFCCCCRHDTAPQCKAWPACMKRWCNKENPAKVCALARSTIMWAQNDRGWIWKLIRSKSSVSEQCKAFQVWKHSFSFAHKIST